MASQEELVELRGKTPKPIIDVLDAICIARGCDRFDVVNEVLLRWARQLAREAIVISRVTQGNPRVMDSNWQALEE